MLDVTLHRSLKDAEAIGLSLSESFLIVPAVVADAVAGHDGSRTIRAAPAVYKHGPLVAVVQDTERGG